MLQVKFTVTQCLSFRLIPGAKKTIMSWLDITKPMNAQRILGKEPKMALRPQKCNKCVVDLILHPLSCRPNQVAEKVAARICENFSETAIVMVNKNQRFNVQKSIHLSIKCIGSDKKVNTLQQSCHFLFLPSGGQWSIDHRLLWANCGYLRSSWKQVEKQRSDFVSVWHCSWCNFCKKENCQFFAVFINSDKICHCLCYSETFEDWGEAQKITSALLEGRSYENLVDFDNHLDDLRNDWTNPVINKSVLDLC